MLGAIAESTCFHCRCGGWVVGVSWVAMTVVIDGVFAGFFPECGQELVEFDFCHVGDVFVSAAIPYPERSVGVIVIGCGHDFNFVLAPILILARLLL